MDIGIKIKKIRTDNNLSIQDFAKKLKVDKTKILSWEKNLSRPNNNTLKKIADFFNVDINYFFSDFKKNIMKKDTSSSNNSTTSILNKISNQLDKLISIVENKPNLQDIKEIETTFSMEIANKFLKEGWVLLELFRNEKGILGYRLGKK